MDMQALVSLVPLAVTIALVCGAVWWSRRRVRNAPRRPDPTLSLPVFLEIATPAPTAVATNAGVSYGPDRHQQ